MAKKILTLGLYALLTLLLGALLMQVMQRQRIKKHVAEQKQNLPDFVFYNLASSKVTRDSLRHGQSTCIIYLDPDCVFRRRASAPDNEALLMIAVHHEFGSENALPVRVFFI